MREYIFPHDDWTDSIRYFYGLPWSKHIVIYDTLIEKSKPEEVEAVLGKSSLASVYDMLT